MKHSDDIVNLSPIRWLQDPLGGRDFLRFEDIRNKISSLETISARDAQNVFGNVMGMDLGVYHLTSIGGWDSTSLQDKLCKKILNKGAIFTEYDINKKDGYRVRIAKMMSAKSHGSGNRVIIGLNAQKLICFKDGKKDGKWWYEYYGKNQWSVETETIPYSLPFSSEAEAENFINVMSNTNVGRLYFHKMMIDINVYPRAFIKLDYTHPWTDDMLYKYFGLTDDEIKTIENEEN